MSDSGLRLLHEFVRTGAQEPVKFGTKYWKRSSNQKLFYK